MMIPSKRGILVLMAIATFFAVKSSTEAFAGPASEVIQRTLEQVLGVLHDPY
ncbi:MAG TPA: hypothetical protein VJ692_03485 [Nitrospiraceae bacterium]|nr:hypothetical protein [Nitrospiraceae bacterium]